MSLFDLARYNQITAAGRRPGRTAGSSLRRWAWRQGVMSALALLVCLMLAAALAGPAWAGAGGTPLGTVLSPKADVVDLNNGAATYAYPIAVPPYYGLEPNLSLVYNSSSDNGWPGMGWELAGLSVIQRASPGKGAPKYDANDIYLLDGQELVPCAAEGGTGTHCTQINDAHLRIQWDGTYNQWYIWTTDGTKATYTAVNITGRTDYRWVLTTVADTRGHTVTYTYGCDGTNECYLSTVTYNNVTVTFYREARTDSIKYATGAGLATMSYRLKTIDVTMSGNRLWAYKLAYIPSSSTARSLLTSLQQYGSDATLDGSGSVTGGSALPAVTVSYQQDANGLGVSSPQWASQQGSYLANTCTSSTHCWYVADFNGDGKADWANMRAVSGNWTADVHRSTGSSFVQETWANQQGSYDPVNQVWYKGDFNGDGKTDFAKYWNDGGSWTADVHLSTGSSFTMARWATQQGGYATSQKWYTGDFNGDGKTDFAKFWNDNNNWTADVHLSTGSSFTIQRWATQQGGYWDAQIWRTGDYNGDGKTDFAKFWNDGNKWTADVHLSTGSGFTIARWATQQTNYVAGSLLLPADYNGDGKTDISVTWFDASNKRNIDVYLSTGSAFTSSRWATQMGNYPFGVGLGDFNGDGQIDMVAYEYPQSSPYPVSVYVYRSTGSAFQYETWGSNLFNASGITGASFNDFTGDGKTELSIFWNASNYWSSNVYYSAGRASDLMSTLANGQGGTTTFAYTPSSAWANTNLPEGLVLQAVSSITANDGLGGSITTNYSYQGGQYDALSRELRGFQQVTVTDASGAYNVTTFLQDNTYKGLVASTESRASGGALMSKVDYTYASATPCTGVTVRTLQNAVASIYEGQASPKQTKVEYTYDAYGNVLTAYNYGDVAASGDESKTTDEYAYNTTAWIVSLPKHTYSEGYKPGDASLTKYRESWAYYDNQAYGTVTLGNLTKTEAWLSGGANVVNTFEYDIYGNVTKTQDGRANAGDYTGYTSQIAYDTTYHAYPTSVTDAKGFVAYTAYDSLMRPTSVTDINGQVTTTEYDVFGRTTKVVRPGDSSASPTTEYVYGLDGVAPESTLVKARETAGGGTLDSYTIVDGLGRTIQTKSEAQAAGQWVTVDSTYDTRGLLQSTSVPYTSPDVLIEAEVTPYHQCGAVQGNVWLSPDAGSGACYLTYGPYQAPAVAGAGQAAHFWLAIDVATGSDAVATVDVFDSTAQQQIAIRTLYRNEFASGLANWRDFTLTFDTTNRAGHSLEYRVFWANTAKMAHDKTMVLWRDTTQKKTTTSYDALGRSIQTTYPDGTTSSVSYSIAVNEGDGDFNNGGRRIKWLTDAEGHAIRQSFDAYGNIQTVSEIISTSPSWVEYRTQYQYNTGTGELVKITDAQSNVWTFTYDTLGRKTAMSDLDMGAWSYIYDANGNLKTQTDAKSKTVTLAYDALNRLTSKSYPSGNPDVYTYDTVVSGQYNKGHLVKVEQSGMYAREWGYDARGRALFEKLTVDSKVWNTYYAYDSADRVTSITLPDGEVVANTYNAQGLPATVACTSNCPAGVSTYLSSANYNAFGRLTSEVYGNGVTTGYDYYDTSGETDPVAGVAFSYRLRTLDLSNASMSLTYQYDKVGNVKNVVDNQDSGKSQSFGYDPLNRLTSASGVYGSKTYTFDAVGNLTAKDGRSYAYSGTTHRVTGDETYTYEYDANGNITTRKLSGVVDRTFEYNANNMLTTVKNSADQVLERYDYQGEARFKKTTGGKTTYYVNQYYEEEWIEGPPSGLTASTSSQTQISLAWSDNSSNEVGFKLERSPDGVNNWTQIATVGTNVTSYSNSGLACGTAYSYRVRAFYAVGDDSGYSNIATTTTAACNTPTPVPPTSTKTPTPVPPTATKTPTPVPPTATKTPTPPTATNTPTVAPTTNLISNSDFTATTGWTYSENGSAWTGAYDTNDYHSAAQSYKIAYPWSTASTAGYYAAIAQTFSVASAPCYILDFWVKDNFTSGTAGYHFKQVLIDGAVAWEDDVAGDEGGWWHVSANVSAWLVGKTSATITLRVYDKAGVGNFGVSTWWDDVTLVPRTGTNQVSNGDFTTTAGWTYSENGSPWTGAYATDAYHSAAQSYKITYPWSTASTAGYYAAIAQTFSVASAPWYTLDFWVKDDYTGGTAGYHFKQVLIDGVVITAVEDDVAGDEGGWKHYVADVTSQLSGKGSATITLRVYDKAGVSSFGVSTWWDDVTITASSLASAPRDYGFASLSQPQDGGGPALPLLIGVGLIALAMVTIQARRSLVPRLAAFNIQWRANRLLALAARTALAAVVLAATYGAYISQPAQAMPQASHADTSANPVNRLATASKTNTIKHYFANGQMIATRDNEGLKFNHTDHLGSASRTSNTSGADVRTIRYDPWGYTQSSWGSGTAVVKYTFTGKEQDSTGLYYYGARYYEPVLGRFITPDSIVQNPYDPQFLNRYAYVRNNPLRLTDPSGHVDMDMERGAEGATAWAINKAVGYTSQLGGIKTAGRVADVITYDEPLVDKAARVASIPLNIMWGAPDWAVKPGTVEQAVPSEGEIIAKVIYSDVPGRVWDGLTQIATTGKYTGPRNAGGPAGAAAPGSPASPAVPAPGSPAATVLGNPAAAARRCGGRICGHGGNGRGPMDSNGYSTSPYGYEYANVNGNRVQAYYYPNMLDRHGSAGQFRDASGNIYARPAGGGYGSLVMTQSYDAAFWTTWRSMTSGMRQSPSGGTLQNMTDRLMQRNPGLHPIK